MTMPLDQVESSTTLPEDASEEPVEDANMNLDVVERSDLKDVTEPDLMSSPIFAPVALAIGLFVVLAGVFLVKSRKKPALPVEENQAQPITPQPPVEKPAKAPEEKK